jgi:hypothetical protein
MPSQADCWVPQIQLSRLGGALWRRKSDFRAVGDASIGIYLPW